MHLSAKIALRLVACMAASYLAFKIAGAVGAIFSIPLYGVALAAPIFELFEHTGAQLRGHALQHLNGRYYVYRGKPLEIDVDDAGHCWLSVEQLRGAGLALPGNPAMLARLADAERVCTGQLVTKLRADALLRELSGTSNENSHRFALWLRRQAVEPAMRARERNRTDRRP